MGNALPKALLLLLALGCATAFSDHGPTGNVWTPLECYNVPLCDAAAGGVAGPGFMALLAKAGADVDEQTLHGDSALMMAAAKGHAAVAKALLAAGATVVGCCPAKLGGCRCMQNTGGWTALDIAKNPPEVVYSQENNNKGMAAVINLLTKAEPLQQKRLAAEEEQRWSRTLRYRDENGKRKTPKPLKNVARLRQGESAWSKQLCSDIPLCNEAAYGRLNNVQELLVPGAMTHDQEQRLVDIDEQDNYGATALSRAAIRGHGAVVAALLKAGAEPDLQDESGSSPLMGAAQEGFTRIGKALLKGGADPDLLNTVGQTAMHAATDLDRVPFVKLLLRYANANVQDKVRCPLRCPPLPPCCWAD